MTISNARVALQKQAQGPAGVVHRFEDFSDDFATWVFFYGPEGGEAVEEARPGRD